MTRINCVPVRELSDKHLIAEYHELPRVFTLIKKAQARGENINDPRNPKEYTLGTGHVRFFYDKVLYLSLHYMVLNYEVRKRGFIVNSVLFNDIMQSLGTIEKERWNDWTPDAKALAINRQRLADRS